MPEKVVLAALAILALALTAHLWPEWTRDPDLSHGLLMPVVCVVLLNLGLNPAARDTLGGRTAAFLAAVLGAASLACLWGAGLLAATLDWSSPVVDFALACSLALVGCAALAVFADRKVSLIAFNGTTVCAAALWALCAPLPPGTYSRLTLALQLRVSAGVMRTLDLLGIVAHRHGNIIELSRGAVGVEEACSGVRSLVSCVFAGLLLAATLVRRPWARVLLVALAAPLALAMNFLRSLLLTLLVNAGVRVEGAWHDVTGYAVLGVTAANLFCLAHGLGGSAAPAAPGNTGWRPAPGGDKGPTAIGVLGVVLAVGAATLVFFVAATRSSAPSGRPAPDLTTMLPASADGWQVSTTRGLYRFAGTLRTDHLAQRSYLRRDAAGAAQVTLYVAYWQEGQASVGLVASHTPDACWPGSGWAAVPVPDPRAALSIGGRTLPVADHRLFMSGAYPQQVWYWQLHDGRPIDPGDPRSVPALIGFAFRYGFQRAGTQAFVRISSNRPWDEISREPFVREFIGGARELGLY